MRETMRKHNEKGDAAGHISFTTASHGQHNGQHTSQPTTSSGAVFANHEKQKPTPLRPSHPSTDTPHHTRPQGGMARPPLPNPYPPTSARTNLPQQARPQPQRGNSHDADYHLPQTTFSTYSISTATHHDRPHSPIFPLSQISPLTRTALALHDLSPVSPIPISPLTREALARHDALTTSQASSRSARTEYRPHPPPQLQHRGQRHPQRQQQRKKSAPRRPSSPLAIVASTQHSTEALVTPFPTYEPTREEAAEWARRGARAAEKARRKELRELIRQRRGMQPERRRQKRQVQFKGGKGQQKKMMANLAAELRALHASGPRGEAEVLASFIHKRWPNRERMGEGGRGEGEVFAAFLRKAFKSWGKGRKEADVPFRADPIRGGAERVPELEEKLKAVRYEDTMAGRAPKLVERITPDPPPLPMGLPVERSEPERGMNGQTWQTGEERSSERAMSLSLEEFNAKALEVHNAHQRRKEEERRAAASGSSTLPPGLRKSNESAAITIVLAQQPEIQPTRPARSTRPGTPGTTSFGPQPPSFSSPRTPKTTADGIHRGVTSPLQFQGPPRRLSPRPPPPPPITIPQAPTRQAPGRPAPVRPERSPVDLARNAAMRNPVEVRPFPQSLRAGRAQETKQEKKSPSGLLSRWQQKLVGLPLKGLFESPRTTKQESEQQVQTPAPERGTEHDTKYNDVINAALGAPKEKDDEEDRKSKLKAMISSPGPLMSTNRNAVNVSAASGGVGGLHAALSLPFRSNSRRAVEKALPPPPPARTESREKAGKEKKLKIPAPETVHPPKILSAKHQRLSSGTTFSDFLHPELGKSVFSRTPKTPKIPRKPVQQRKGSDESFACQGIGEEREGEAPSSPTSTYRSGLPPSVYGPGTLIPEVQTARIDSDMSFSCKGPYDDDHRDLHEPPTPITRHGVGPSNPAGGFSGRHRASNARAPTFPGYGQHVAEARAPPSRGPGVLGRQPRKKLLYQFEEDTDDEAEYTPHPLVVRKSANNTPDNLPPVQEEALASPPGVQRPRPRDTRFYEPYRKLLEEYER
ncbi:uncharacterized protein BDZ99DRAFT_563469 [Mytilinidion resinicola]|uniref:Uncharacterized protein n=1 Tax=Mytilinidion resinicola TaxID=574789 RepID=A0A6A6YQZ8_9PEZI|nr:uncharacterized protein BDZ99DRAFT_563469 [Mytilinidion resinicola]KAF2810444.1 hypothetical protein BDZ99DRAFT_563469 [Mytilinidion resinicola]